MIFFFWEKENFFLRSLFIFCMEFFVFSRLFFNVLDIAKTVLLKSVYDG